MPLSPDRTSHRPVAADAHARVADLLIRTGAITFRTAPFFTFTSGVESPVYVDNRRLLGFVAERRQVVAELVHVGRELGAEAVAGTATAGIPWAAWLADVLELPLMYVRSGAKGWGRQQAVEGIAEPGAHTLLIEDLAFSGGSLVAAAEQLQAAGYRVTDCLTIVTYGTPNAQRSFEEASIRHHALTTIDAALDAAASTGALTPDETAIVDRWLATQRQAGTGADDG